MRKGVAAVLLIGTLLAGCGGGGGSEGGTAGLPQGNIATGPVVLAANDLGMHCLDREFSVFSILPPFNVVNAQVVKQDINGHPFVADALGVDVFYSAVADPTGSINSFSIGKTDFWQHSNALFGVNLQNGEGLTGLFMPGDDPLNRDRQPIAFNLQKGLFSAEGVPITPVDDNLSSNPYSLMRVSAVDRQSGQDLAHLDVVLPVAVETDCRNCHVTGGIATVAPGVNWSQDPDIEIQTKINVLIMHDAGTGTNLENLQPVLCARCHYSPALDLAGTGPAGDQLGNPVFSRAVHGFHGRLPGPVGPLFPPNGPVNATCYQCHPGNITQCQRGAMKTGGMDCNDCHGDMLSVGGNFPLLAGGSIDGTNDGGLRRPWLDLPRCQSCHTGDAVNHLTGANQVADPNWPFRLRQAYTTGDNAASPLLATNKRFAENLNTLFRFSKGHGGIFCEGCHGSTHAIWPNADPGHNDNQAAVSLQGYASAIGECGVCHEAGSLPPTLNGPHGMHNVNEPLWFNGGHGQFYLNDKNACKSCHGTDLLGTPLSKMPTDRIPNVEGAISFAKGDFVRCDLCHAMPPL